MSGVKVFDQIRGLGGLNRPHSK